MYQFVIAEMPKLNDKVPNIHYGGCCMFAEELYGVLKELGHEPKIFVITSYPKLLQNFIDGEETNQIDICHVLIEVDGKLMDNTGIYDSQYDLPNHRTQDHLYISFDVLKRINAEITGWNSRFNRNQIPQVKDFLKEVKENVKKNLVK